MIKLKTILSEILFTEALDVGMAKEYTSIKRNKYIQERLDTIFTQLAKTSGATTSKRGDRIYIPFEGSKTQVTNTSPVEKEIETALSGTDFKLKDYVKGIVLDKLGRDQKIGKVLTKLGKPELVNKFNADKTREGSKKSELMLVFSKHPYDIAGMSTDRGWSSCMELYTGAFKKYVKLDIKEGSFVIYLAKSDDLNLESPRARCVAKPYINIESKKDVVYSTGSTIYGTAPGNFITTVQELIDTTQPNKVGLFKLDSKLYCDAQLKTIEKITPEIQSLIDGKTKATTKDQVKIILDSFLRIKNYTINKNLTVDVTGDVIISSKGLKVIPVQFGVVTGAFNCTENQLTTLQGTPTKVGGNFHCGGNKLTTLQGGPTEVAGTFSCAGNQLTTLKGAPTKVVGNFYCNDNQLTTLQGGPIKVGKNFFCNSNQLTTLQGGPTEVGDSFYCGNNKLTTLQGGPTEVGGGFHCSDNQLTTLKGGPTEVGDFFYCGGNKLTTLEGGPTKVGKDFDCSKNQLTTLQGGPTEVGRDFDFRKNPLSKEAIEWAKSNITVGGSYIGK